MKVAIFTKRTKILFLVAVAVAAVTALSCKSAPVLITDDMTSQQLIQKGQDSYQRNNYKDAKKYYQAAIDMYGSDKAVYVEARYELGHLYMKQKKYKEAEPVFTEIEQIFRESIPGTLPAAYKKLAEIELQKIPSRNTKEETPAQTNTLAPDQY